MIWKMLITVFLLSCFYGYSSAFDVKAVTDLTESPRGYLCLSCQFAPGALGRGCFVVLTSRVDGSTTSKNGFKLTNADTARVCFTLREGGYYTLLAYDIEQDGSVNTADPAVSLLVYVQGPTERPSTETPSRDSGNGNTGVTVGGSVGGVGTFFGIVFLCCICCCWLGASGS